MDCAYLRQSLDERHGTPQTGRQSITRTHRVIPKGDIERPVNLIVLFSDVFGLWQDTSVPVEKPRMHKEDM